MKFIAGNDCSPKKGLFRKILDWHRPLSPGEGETEEVDGSIDSASLRPSLVVIREEALNADESRLIASHEGERISLSLSLSSLLPRSLTRLPTKSAKQVGYSPPAAGGIIIRLVVFDFNRERERERERESLRVIIGRRMSPIRKEKRVMYSV